MGNHAGLGSCAGQAHRQAAWTRHAVLTCRAGACKPVRGGLECVAGRISFWSAAQLSVFSGLQRPAEGQDLCIPCSPAGSSL
jgi:hypothetical protein